MTVNQGTRVAFGLGPDDEVSPEDTYSQTFFKAATLLATSVHSELKGSESFKLFTLISWDSALATSELAIVDTRTGEVLVIGVSSL